MKIICINCKRQMGEIPPFEDAKEAKAKCTDCLKAEKEAQLKKLMEIPLSQKEPKDRIVTFENGARGFLTIAGKETKNLGFWGILFEDKEFFCCSETRKDFEKFLKSLPEEELEITFLHSAEIAFDPPQGRRGKRKKPAPDNKPKESIDFNCTVRGTKDFARHVFETKEGQLEQYIDIIWPIAERMYLEEKAAKEGEMSGNPDRT